MVPQIIYLVITFIGMLLVANKHGQPRINYNFWETLISSIIIFTLLIWGGFFDGFLN